MAGYLDENDRDVAGLLAAYDELARRSEAYLASLDRQLADAAQAGRLQPARHLETGKRFAQELTALLDGEVLDALMNLRNNQHHIRMAKAGKLV